MPEQDAPPELDFRRDGSDCLTIVLRGTWKMQQQLPDSDRVQQELAPGLSRLAFDAQGVSGWDSGLMTFLLRCWDLAGANKIQIDSEGLPKGVNGLMKLATAVPEKEGTGRGVTTRSLFYRVGSQSIALAEEAQEIFTFLGEAVIAFFRFFTGRARFRWSDLWVVVQQTGAEALPIVALISFLVGLILAYVGAVQLAQFGATIYVADLVGLAMVREMGAIMTAIVMCGRTGAAFAAQLGTMKVSEEIDALQTLGISPMEFLVLPRMLALCCMLPLLVLFSDFIGILGGLVVSITTLDISFQQFVNRTIAAIDLANFSSGLIKSVFFGVLVASTGCLRGMQCGDSSAAVGVAATSAVVTGITCIIVADAVFAVIFNILGI
ncbi:ABC transporter permease [Ruficoccus amylovorans]|uniref:ABC transporter permease n=1 Tax=Ruficoccus amylovorans TaxID=1804625 RepID=A0A842HHJ8_9BACT|nr:ABC transporter permease [Ruficoccus amylovorans]MBC2595086.1 ABC transporter permease [Ruficoccus amylovorans]